MPQAADRDERAKVLQVAGRNDGVRDPGHVGRRAEKAFDGLEEGLNGPDGTHLVEEAQVNRWQGCRIGDRSRVVRMVMGRWHQLLARVGIIRRGGGIVRRAVPKWVVLE